MVVCCWSESAYFVIYSREKFCRHVEWWHEFGTERGAVRCICMLRDVLCCFDVFTSVAESIEVFSLCTFDGLL
jgi:hypothetical protein